jgi:hypothetical protein
VIGTSAALNDEEEQKEIVPLVIVLLKEICERVVSGFGKKSF